MAQVQNFARELKIAGSQWPDEIGKLLAEFARAQLAEFQGTGQMPGGYDRVVNGRVGASEDTVIAPGPIVYVANWWPEVTTYGLNFVRHRSPVKSGRFRDAWIVLRNGIEMSIETLSRSSPEDEIIIVNPEPYSLRLEVGKTESGRAFVIRVPPGIVEDARQALMARFGAIIRIERKFINLAGSPYKHPAIVMSRRLD